MSDFGKNRVLALYKILTKYTDEQHHKVGLYNGKRLVTEFYIKRSMKYSA